MNGLQLEDAYPAKKYWQEQEGGDECHYSVVNLVLPPQAEAGDNQP